MVLILVLKFSGIIGKLLSDVCNKVRVFLVFFVLELFIKIKFFLVLI